MRYEWRYAYAPFAATDDKDWEKSTPSAHEAELWSKPPEEHLRTLLEYGYELTVVNHRDGLGVLASLSPTDWGLWVLAVVGD